MITLLSNLGNCKTSRMKSFRKSQTLFPFSGCSLTFLEHYIGVEVLPMLSSRYGIIVK